MKDWPHFSAWSYGAAQFVKTGFFGESYAPLKADFWHIDKLRAAVLETLSTFCRPIGLDLERNLYKGLQWKGSEESWTLWEINSGKTQHLKIFCSIWLREVGDIAIFQECNNLCDLWAHAIKIGQKGYLQWLFNDPNENTIYFNQKKTWTE